MSQPSDVNCHYTLYIIHYTLYTILTILHLKSVFLLWKWNMFGHNKKRNKIIESLLRCLAALGQMDGDPGAEQLECPGDDKETQKRGPGRPRSEKYTEVISRTSHETYASYRKALQKQYENNWTLAIDIFFGEPAFILYILWAILYIYICGYGSRGRITHLWPVTQHRYITMSLGQEQVAKSEPTKAKERNENPNRRSQQLLKPLHLSMRHLRSLRHLRSFRHLRGLRSLGSGNDAWIRN